MVPAIIAVLAIAIMLGVGWFIATRMKRKIDDESRSVSGVPRRLQVTGACVAGLSQLTREPILMRREDGRVSLQVGEQPMRALEAVPDRGVRAALREAAVAVDAVFGPQWMAIMRAASESTLLVTRLA